MMVETVFLHIGMHKTGSSSIQASLRGYDDGKLRYARLGNANHSICLYTVFSDNWRNYHIHKSLNLDEDAILKKKRAFKDVLTAELELNREILVFSGEDLSTFSESEVARLRDFLSSYTSDIRILAYAREPMGFMASNLQEDLKNGQFRGAIAPPRYRDRFGPYLSVFGSKAVEIFEFGRILRSSDGLVDHFCDAIGVDPKEVEIKRENESLSADALRLLAHLDAFGSKIAALPNYGAKRHNFIDFVRDVFPGTCDLKPYIPQRYIEQEDIDWLAGEVGIEFEKPREKRDPVAGQSIRTFQKLDPKIDYFGLVSSAFVDAVGRVPKSDALTDLLVEVFVDLPTRSKLSEPDAETLLVDATNTSGTHESFPKPREISRQLKRAGGRVLSLLGQTVFEGYFDAVEDGHAKGWVKQIPSKGSVPVVLEYDGAVIAQGLADRPRTDLEKAGLGECGFSLRIPGNLDESLLQVRVKGTDRYLKRSF